MKGDFTRFTFDRKKLYTGVLKQQGRVDLDADWNEQSAIDSYLDRISRMDLSGVENGAPSLKPGFEVTLKSGAPGSVDLNLSAGRFYAEGLICELFDPASYLHQPFYPNPPALAPVDGQTDLVYLDVWQRHITAIEDPSIREIALEGPDTCTRVQTVFQVKIASNVGAVDCPNAPLPQKSGALLTTSIVPVPPEDDLCLIGAAGGYKGLENRLYRVEIHASGALGTATFKWSRDNGSVAFPITEFVAGQPNKIRVKRLGRDQVLTLHEGDFVEVLDDNNELLGQPGTIAQIQAIDAANLELTLTGPALNVPTSGNLSDHPKVRRWDQKSLPISTAAGPIALEDGIQISFAGSNFQTGDYWMFAARATDGTIEILTNAQPQGIRHEYARLALVTWHGPAPFKITPHDCRTIFPAGGKDCCCCTVTVGDGSKSKGDFTDIQKAIDSLPQTNEFAEVCILPGLYVIPNTIAIHRSNLLVRGCGQRAVIQGPLNSPAFEAPAFQVSASSNVSFEWLTVSAPQAIKATGVSKLRIVDCLFDAQRGFSVEVSAQDCIISENTCHGGIWIMDGSNDIRIFHNRIENGTSQGIGIGGAQENEFEIRNVDVRDNQIIGNRESGIATLFESDRGSLGIDGITIAGNVIDSNAGAPQQPRVAMGGVVLENARNVRILDNEIDNNGIGKLSACGIFLQDCSNVDIEENSILDNGNTDGVIHAECVDFQTKNPGEQLDNPVKANSVTFTLKDQGGTLPQKAPIFKIGTFTGLAGTINIVIDLPASDSVAIQLFIPSALNPNNSITLTALANTTQTDTSTVTASNSAQTVALFGPGITQVTITALSEFVLLEFCRFIAPAVAGWQGGIMANRINAEPVSNQTNKISFPKGYPAICVHDNIVNTPAGQSLLIIASGQVSVEGNALTSNGARNQADLPPFPEGPFGVFIFDLGLAYPPQVTFLSGAFLAMFFLIATSNKLEGIKLLWDGRVAFEGNQVAYRALNGTIADGSLASGIFTLDACQITGNQFRAEAAGRVIGADLRASGDTVCITGNGFSELPNTALFSCTSHGRNVMTVLNQSMHCLSTSGSQQTLQQNNQVTITTLCPQFSRRLQSVLRNREVTAQPKPFSSQVERATNTMEKTFSSLNDGAMSVLESWVKKQRERAARFEAAAKILVKKKVDPSDPQMIAVQTGQKQSQQLAESLDLALRRVKALPQPVFGQQMFAGTVRNADGNVVQHAVVQLVETVNNVAKTISQTESNIFGDFAMNVPLSALTASEWQLVVVDKAGQKLASELVSIDPAQGVIAFVSLVLSPVPAVGTGSSSKPAPPAAATPTVPAATPTATPTANTARTIEDADAGEGRPKRKSKKPKRAKENDSEEEGI
jgi:hypothetical protein